MQNENARNTIIFVVCTVAILLIYQFLVLQPQAERRKAAAKAAERPPAVEEAGKTGAAPGVLSSSGAPRYADRRQALAAAPRIAIDTPGTEGETDSKGGVKGSLSLRGARIDDLFLKGYHDTVDRSSPNVELLRPEGLPNAYFAQIAWTGANLPGLPNESTLWTVKSGDVLAPGKPVVLTYSTPEGLRFQRTIAVDRQSMFTITDQVANFTGRPVTLLPYSSVQRHDIPAGLGKLQIVHEGAIGVFDGALRQFKYGKWAKEKAPFVAQTTGGWMGITDKYWMTSIVPNQTETGTGRFRITDVGGVKVHEAVFEGKVRTIPQGHMLVKPVVTRIFAGAKRNEVLVGYQDSLGIPSFHKAIDWGILWFFTRPLFTVLEFFYHLVGNFGLAILALTVVVKLVFFPLANKAYASMAKIKKLQPKQEELKKKYGDDPTKMQQEMMALYQREKINPLAGCLPILIQIPVFYALYKVLYVTIEMRHAPFFGWIQDLSARDPTTIWNLFGLIPWNPATTPVIGGLLDGALHLGLLPLVYGLTMWLQTAMNPPATDPTQQMIMKWFPVIFTVMLATQPAGLLVYWAWSNVLTIIQQYIIMRANKTENPIDGLIARLQGREYKVEA